MSEPSGSSRPALRRGLVALVAALSLVGFLSGFTLALQRRDLAERWLLTRAREAGLPSPSAFVGRLDWGTLEVHELRAAEGAFEIVGLEGSFGLGSLLSGRFDELRVRGVELRGRRQELAPLLTALEALLRPGSGTGIPWEQLTVESARVVVESDGGEAELFGSGRVSQGEGALEAEARLEASLGPLRARIAFSGSGTPPDLAGEAALELVASEPAQGRDRTEGSLRSQATFRTTRETIEVTADPCADLVVGGLRLGPLGSLASPLRTCLGGAEPAALHLRRTSGEAWELEGRLEALPVSLDLALADGSRAQAETPHLGLALEGSLGAPQATLSSRGGFLRLEKAGFEARDLTGSLAWRDGAAEGRVRLSEIEDLLETRRLPRLRLTLDARRQRSGTGFELRLQDDARRLGLEIVGRVATDGPARAELRLEPVSLDAEGIELLRALPPLADSTASGTLAALGSGVWGSDGPEGHLELALRDVGLASRHAHVELASGVVRLEGPMPLTAPPDQLLSMARLDMGLELLDGFARFGLDAERGPVVDGSRFSFAGGWAEARGALHGEEPLVLTVGGVDPAALFDGLDLPELVGEGSLAGTLALTPGDEGLAIQASLLSEEAGGLRYRPGAEEPEEVRQALAPHAEALADFRYDELEVGFSGRLPGAVDVVVTLAGSSPALPADTGELLVEVPGALEPRPGTTLREHVLPDEVEARLAAFEAQLGERAPARARAPSPSP